MAEIVLVEVLGVRVKVAELAGVAGIRVDVAVLEEVVGVRVEVAGLLVLFGCVFSMVAAAAVSPSARSACIGTDASPTVLLPSLIRLLIR